SVALELVVQVGVRIEMQDGEPRVVWADSAQRGIGDRMVTPEHERAATRRPDQPEGILDHLADVLRPFALAEDQISVVLEPACPEISPFFGPGVPGLRPERLAN